MRFGKCFAAVLACQAVAAQQEKTKAEKSCRALAMSGGGALGAFEAGALWGMVQTSNSTADFEYDVVSGVSAGSINALAVSLFEKGDELNMVQWLSDQWALLTTDQVYVDWKPAGILTGLTTKSGIWDTTPLYHLLSNFIEEKGGIKRMFEVACVDVNDGSYTTFNETVSDPAKASVSSSSIPTVFPHQIWENYDGKDQVVCMDGGTVWNTNIVSAIKRCQDQVDDDSQITLDVILCGGSSLSSWNDQNNAIGNYLRYKDVKDYNQGTNDVMEFLQAYPNVNFRYYVEPSEALPGGLSILSFNNETVTWPSQMQGRLDGENAIKDGKGMMFSKFKEWQASKDLQSKYPKVGSYVRKNIIERAELHKQERRHQTWCESPSDPLCAEQAAAETLIQ